MTDSKTHQESQGVRIDRGQEMRLWGIPLVFVLGALSFLWGQSQRLVVVETNQALMVDTIGELKDAMKDQGKSTRHHILQINTDIRAIREDVVRLQSHP